MFNVCFPFCLSFSAVRCRTYRCAYKAVLFCFYGKFFQDVFRKCKTDPFTAHLYPPKIILSAAYPPFSADALQVHYLPVFQALYFYAGSTVRAAEIIFLCFPHPFNQIRKLSDRHTNLYNEFTTSAFTTALPNSAARFIAFLVQLLTSSG